MNVAVAVFGLVMLTVQVAPLTEVQPDQLLKSEPGAGSATSVMVAPFATEVEHPVVAPVVQLDARAADASRSRRTPRRSRR